MKLKSICFLLIIICCSMLPTITTAQFSDPLPVTPFNSSSSQSSTSAVDPGPIPLSPVDTAAPTPIDGGLSLLIAAGIGVGYKRYRNKKNKPSGINEEGSNSAV